MRVVLQHGDYTAEIRNDDDWSIADAIAKACLCIGVDTEEVKNALEKREKEENE